MSKCSVRNYLWACIILLLSSTSLADSKAELSLIFLQPQKSTEVKLASELKASMEIKDLVSLVNELFILPRKVELVFGKDDHPLYDSAESRIYIAYDFMREVRERFKASNYTSETGISIKDASMDSLMHTIFHELAHALIDIYQLPVLGKEEDAADSLAAVMLIEFFQDGQEIVISAADLFDLESQDTESFEEQDFWSMHSLDAQRYYSSKCHVYGSNPKEYKNIPSDEKFTNERAETCIEEYELLVESWMKLLVPHMKKGQI